jgi:hypothetical protein
MKISSFWKQESNCTEHTQFADASANQHTAIGCGNTPPKMVSFGACAAVRAGDFLFT